MDYNTKLLFSILKITNDVPACVKSCAENITMDVCKHNANGYYVEGNPQMQEIGGYIVCTVMMARK